MATIGSLAVNIVATTDKFISGLSQASTRLGKFVGSMGVATKAAAAFAFVGLGAVVKQAIDAGGALFDLSVKLRISTEALSALNFAASQTGVSTEALHRSLSMMTRKIGEASLGSKSALAAFENLGLSFEDIIGMKPEQQFLAIVGALNQMGSSEEQAAAGAAILGKGMKELTGMITAGEQAITDFGKQAADLGLIVNEDIAAGLDEASDSLATFHQQWAAFKMNFVGEYAPEIQTALDILVGSMQRIQQAMALVSGSMIMGMEAIAKYYAFMTGNENLQQIGDSLEKSRKRQHQILMGTNATPNPLGGSGAPATATKETAKNTEKANKQLDEQTKLLREMRDRIRNGNPNSVLLGTDDLLG